jgi:hypothetical protein
MADRPLRRLPARGARGWSRASLAARPCILGAFEELERIARSVLSAGLCPADNTDAPGFSYCADSGSSPDSPFSVYCRLKKGNVSG